MCTRLAYGPVSNGPRLGASRCSLRSLFWLFRVGCADWKNGFGNVLEEGVVVVVSVEVFDPSCGFSVVPKVVRQHGAGVGSVSRLGGGTENGVVVEGSPSGAAVGFPGVQSFQQPFGVACEVVVVSDKVHVGPDFGFKKLRLGSPVVVVAGFNHFDKVGKVGGFGFAVVVGWCGAAPLAYQVSFGGVEEGLVEVGREESFFGFSDKDGAGSTGATS